MNCLDLHCPCELPNHCPKDPMAVAYHTEVIINGEVTIPHVKPPSEKIINTTYKVCITKIAPIKVRLDNGCIEGCKILVKGFVRLGIEYSADIPEQEVHFVHFDLPFQGLILGDPCEEPIPLCDCDLSKFKLNVCLEHLQVHQLNPRTFSKVIVLLLWLEKTDCNKDEKCAKADKCDTNDRNRNDDRDHDCSDSHCSTLPEVSKEIAIDHTLKIPPQKPPAECILNSSVDIKFTKVEVINTPLVVKKCNNPLKKVVVTGKAKITIKYVADVPDQQVHAAVFKVPFETLIEWPDGPPAGTPICINAIVEHFEIDMLTDRRLFKVLIVRLDVYKK